MCHCLEVSHSGYYAWRNRGMSETQKHREELAIFVTYFFNDSKQTYGYRRVHKVLERNGVATSPETVRRLMQPGGPGGGVSPAPRPTTTVPAADLAGRPDLIERNFTADAPARKLVGDITYIHTREGFVYLATVMDCYSKRIVGYAMTEHMRTELVQNALQNWRFGTASPSRV